MFLRTTAEIRCHSLFLVSSISGGPIVRPPHAENCDFFREPAEQKAISKSFGPRE